MRVATKSSSYFHVNAQENDWACSFHLRLKPLLSWPGADMTHLCVTCGSVCMWAAALVHQCVCVITCKVCLPRANKRRCLCWLQSQRKALQRLHNGDVHLCTTCHFLMVIRQVNLPVIARYCCLLVCLFFSQDGSVPLWFLCSTWREATPLANIKTFLFRNLMWKREKWNRTGADCCVVRSYICPAGSFALFFLPLRQLKHMTSGGVGVYAHTHKNTLHLM